MNKPNRFWQEIYDQINNSKNLSDLKEEIKIGLDGGFCCYTPRRLNKIIKEQS